MQRISSNAGARHAPISVPSGKRIIYISSSGSELNDGLTESTPRYDVRRVPEYLKDGCSVLLCADSVWYAPDLMWCLKDISGTEDNPLLVGTYGEGDAPVIGAMHRLPKEAWVSHDGGIMSAVLKGDVLRLYINDKMLLEARDFSELDEMHFVQTDGKIYIKADEAPTLAEAHIDNDGYNKDYVIGFENVSFLTVENLVIKGGYYMAIKGTAPSVRLTFKNMEFRSMLGYGAIIKENKAFPKAYHESIRFEDCIFDKTWTRGACSCYREDAYYKRRVTDGIFLGNAHRGAYIGGNIFKDFGHTAIDFEVTDMGYVGIHDCIIERNIVSGANSEYLRACETIGPEGLCTNNTVRYNYFLDLTNSSHLLGEYNKYYCNVFAFVKPTEISKTVQPYAIDSESWHYNGFEFVARGNVIANNTVYSCTGALEFANNVYTCTVANNLFVGWSYPAAVRMDKTKEEIAFINNCFFGEINDGVIYGSATDTVLKLADLNKRELSSGNIFANPELYNAEKCDFSLRDNSPCANAGTPILSFLDFEYADMNGKPYDKEHPSLGAFSANK